MAFQFRTIKVTAVLERNWEISKRIMAQNLYKVKHWEIINGDYTEAPDIKATWFVDPPYKGPASWDIASVVICSITKLLPIGL